MRAFLYRHSINLIFVSLIGSAVLLIVHPRFFQQFDFRVELPASAQTFKTMLLGIVLETLPFLLLGVLVSSFLQLFVSENAIRRFIPRHPLPGILFGCLLGIMFPVCECGLIPIVRRLLAKGMPLYIGIVFILVGPVVNPVVFAATYTAFRGQPDILYARMGLALLVGAVIGAAVYLLVRNNPLREEQPSAADPGPETHGHSHGHSHPHSQSPFGGSKWLSMMDHAGSELFDMGKYVMIGSILTAAIQSYVPRESLVGIGQGAVSAPLFMMGFAYILSICSTSDAFVASSFASTFTPVSLVAFLVFGPMLDFKSTLMLLAVFQKRFVFLLAVLIAACVLAGAYLAGWLLFSPS